MTDDPRTIRLRAIASDILGFDEHELGKVQQVTEAIKRVREDDLVIPIESANAVDFEIVTVPAESRGNGTPQKSVSAEVATLSGTAAEAPHLPRVVHIPPRLASGTTPPPVPVDARFDVTELDDMFAPHPTDVAFQEAAKRARRATDNRGRK
jgi:hypothetical protein